MSLSLSVAESVLNAGRALQEKGLVVRTWGNVSARSDADYFWITPTGARYEELDACDIVQVCLHSLESKGRRKPSSELSVHAKIYQHFPNISFILHTHQKWASLLGLLCYGKMGSVPVREDFRQVFGKFLPSAAYAQAGSEELAQSLIDAIDACGSDWGGREEETEYGKSGIALMAYHGVVFFARNVEIAFTLAQRLEEYAMSCFLQSLANIVPISSNLLPPPEPYLAYPLRPFSSKYTLDLELFFIGKEDSASLSHLFACLAGSDMVKLVDMQPEADAMVTKGIGAYFDDVAQIAGSFFEVCSFEMLECRKICKQSIFIIEGKGVLIASSSQEEAHYMMRLFEKNVYAFLLSLVDERIKPLNCDVANNLHNGYLEGYSKLK